MGAIFRMESIAAITAAITIAESARLNIGQCGIAIQSMTWPRKAPVFGLVRNTRSVRLPNVPPSTRPNTYPHGREVNRGDQKAIAKMTSTAKLARRKVPLVAMLNAAPEFFVRVRLRKSPKILRGALPSKVASAQVLVPLSRSHTSQATKRTLRQIGCFRRNVSAVLPFVYKACTMSREGILASGLFQWHFRTLHSGHRFYHQFAQGHARSEGPCRAH